MAGVTISYKGSQIASMTSTGTKTLTTSGQYCEDNITVGYSAPSLESVTVNAGNLLSQNTTFDTPDLVLYQNDNFNISTFLIIGGVLLSLITIMTIILIKKKG